MKNKILRFLTLVTIWLVSHSAFAQSFLGWQYNDRYFSFSIGTGKVGYQGELSHDKYFQKGVAQLNVGLEARLLNRVSARLEFYNYSITGNDRLAPDNSFEQQRNLSFFANNYEASLSGLYYVLNPYAGKYYKRKATDLFITAGVGVTRFTPMTYLNGTAYNLRDYKTEGVAYGKYALVVPLGIGLKFTLNEFLNVITELGYRVVFTDRLDDVSAKYGGPFTENIEAALANRKSEIGVINQEAYDRMIPNGQRGDLSSKDQYYFASIKIEAYLPRDLLRKKGNKYSKEKILKKPSGFDKIK
jgi:hypothetical protein